MGESIQKKEKILERKNNLIKRGLLTRKGWFVANISWKDLEMPDAKIKKYIENYVFMRDKEKAREMTGI